MYHPYFQFTSGDAAPPVVVIDTVVGGVKKREQKIRLYDVESREELAQFIRSHVQIKPELEPEPVYKIGKRGKKQRDEERMAEIAMRNMHIEVENELRIEYNNQAILMILMAAAAIDD
jgi:hypothetical protein